MISRRAWLGRSAQGFGLLALAALRQEYARAALHHAPKARNVIFLYMDGGPSQIDTFDYKPALEKYHGRDPHEVFNVEPTQFNNVGKVMASPWKFRQHGQSGQWVSELFPNIAGRVDDLCILRSVVSKFSEHTSANYFLHTGSGLQGRPSLGAWLGYGLGTENRDLPGFVVVNGGLIPPGGIDNFLNGFLPATFQGSIFRPVGQPVANILPREGDPKRQRDKLDLVASLDAEALGHLGDDPALEAAIANYETAFRMQAAVPELTDLGGESPATRTLYGLDAEYEPTRIFAAECLMARRLVERGVRFVELTCPDLANDRWDQHSSLKKGHEDNARAVDRPIAGLLADLKGRGLWDSTLVLWAGEFGRTPFAQGSDGRDHNPFGFTIWMAGGGVKSGIAYGETDDFGYKAVQGRVEIHDLHATLLHLLGLDHEKLTYRYSGRDFRLTDVHGRVVEEILA
jgi:hypothetical protein